MRYQTHKKINEVLTAIVVSLIVGLMVYLCAGIWGGDLQVMRFN